MSVRRIDNTPIIKGRVAASIPLAIRFALDDIHRIANPKTPKDRGDLRSQVRKEVRGLRGIITWVSNHAIYQENKQFQNYTTPGTGPNFAKDSVGLVKAKFADYLRKAGVR